MGQMHTVSRRVKPWTILYSTALFSSAQTKHQPQPVLRHAGGEEEEGAEDHCEAVELEVIVDQRGHCYNTLQILETRCVWQQL